MRRLLAVLLLSACGSQESLDEGEEADSAVSSGAGPTAGNLAAGTEDAAELQARVDRAMTAVLQEPRGARYRAVRRGLAGTICGEVDPQRRGGGHTGFRPFLVTPEGVARVATSPRLSFEDPADMFPDFYIRWCASPEELERLEPELRRAIAATAPAGGPALPLPGADGLDLGGMGAEPPAPPVEPPVGGQGPAAATPTDVDSFYKSVRRKRDQPPSGN
jgi:hypothetical protein